MQWVPSCCVRNDGQTSRHEEANTFRKSANAPEKELYYGRFVNEFCFTIYSIIIITVITRKLKNYLFCESSKIVLKVLLDERRCRWFRYDAILKMDL